MQGNNAKLKTSLPLLIALALSGCGGGGDSTTPTNEAPAAITLSGVAAAGAPISGTVTVLGSNSTKKTVDIKADGSFSVDVSDLKAPFMLQAAGTVGDRSYTIYSATTGAGTVNVTPLTDLVVANAAGGAASTAFEAADFSNLTEANLDAAEATLKTRLAPVLQATGAGSVDLMNGAFAADHTGIDAALDLLDVSVSGNTATITVKGDSTATISDDLSLSSDDSKVAPSTDLSTTATDIQAIAQQFSGLNAALQSATTVDANLTKYFVQSDFMWMGQNDLAAFLDSLLQEKPKAMDNISVTGLEQDSNRQNVSAQVSFRLVTQDGREYTGRTEMSKDPNTGVWLIKGDQRIADITVNAFATSCWTNPNGVLESCGVTSGIQFYIGAENPAAAIVDHAEITGPGITTTLTKTTDRSYLNDGSGGNMLVLQDGVIAGIKANSTYTITLFDSNNAQLAQYKINLPKEPSLSSALDSKSSFPFLTDASFNTLNAGPKGTFTLNWTLPENLRMESVVMYLADNANQTYSLDQWVNPKTTSYTYRTTIAGEIMSGYGYLFARDAYGRKLALYYK